MNNGKLFAISTLAALVTIASQANLVLAQEATAKPLRDFGKRMIERPLEKTLAPTSAVPQSTGGLSVASPFVNPKVEPGKVTWHKDFDEACASSKLSGKPVLLFQMMGKLDDGFC